MSSVEVEQEDIETNEINDSDNDISKSTIFSNKNIFIAVGILLAIMACSVVIYFSVVNGNGSSSLGSWSPFLSSTSIMGIQTKESQVIIFQIYPKIYSLDLLDDNLEAKVILQDKNLKFVPSSQSHVFYDNENFYFQVQSDFSIYKLPISNGQIQKLDLKENVLPGFCLGKNQGSDGKGIFSESKIMEIIQLNIMILKVQ